MRTLFWCGCALAVTAASLVYLATDHAYRYPESVVGRCTLFVYHASTDYNPVIRVSQAVSRCAYEAAREARSIVNGKGTQACCAPTPCPSPCPESCDNPPASEDRPVDIIDLANYQIPLPPEADPACNEDRVPNVFPLPVDQNNPNGMSGSIGSSCEPIGSGYQTGFVPSVPGSGVPCSAVKPVGQEPGVQDTSIEEKKDDAPSKAEDSELQDWLKQYEEAAIDAGIGPKDEQVKPEASPEESEAINEGEPPTCQEDVNYHHQYPTCPYMGGCPKSGYCPVQTEPTPVTPKKTRKHKVKQKEPVQPVKPAVPEAESGSEEQEPPTGVDTMEYRKSDARKGEFNKIPF